ncbi:MAG: hypothetical protein HUK22_02005 [Thermoguttaceae bacterium]|nr:hypothetical protein [Thermoguttaceae bacterium]
MKFYYYTCTRCGRARRYLLPRKTAKCSFCETTWRTYKSGKSYSKFSFLAALYWVLIVGAIVGGGCYLNQKFGISNRILHSEKETTASATSPEATIEQCAEVRKEIEEKFDSIARDVDAAVEAAPAKDSSAVEAL